MSQTRLSISEARFQEQVTDLARILGWRVAHFRPARMADGSWRTPVTADGKGFPDLVLAHPTRGVLYRELKTDVGTLTSDQADWITTLSLAGADARVWRPMDIDQIKEQLGA